MYISKGTSITLIVVMGYLVQHTSFKSYQYPTATPKVLCIVPKVDNGSHFKCVYTTPNLVSHNMAFIHSKSIVLHHLSSKLGYITYTKYSTVAFSFLLQGKAVTKYRISKTTWGVMPTKWILQPLPLFFCHRNIDRSMPVYDHKNGIWLSVYNVLEEVQHCLGSIIRWLFKCFWYGTWRSSILVNLTL